MTRTVRMLGLSLALMLASAQAIAAVSTWLVDAEIDNIYFDGAGAVSGRFDHDSDRGVFFNIDIEVVITGSDAFFFSDPDTFFFSDLDISDHTTPDRLFLIEGFGLLNPESDLYGKAFLSLPSATDLDPLSSPVALEHGLFGMCFAPNCDAAFLVQISGTVSATTVPLPAAAWLLISALGILGFIGKRAAVA